MEDFIVSARKYRPTTFDNVVGQESITTTLKNAIRNNHLAQAYLFCGPRGVGKTTCARIFAKTINCQSLNSKIEPCNQCESCRAFNESRSFNVHELDAASNNKVDDIRALIDIVRIPPQIGKYSVYVIDEVHMLSQAAFNAFLKTLEEPPKYAIFILATTEKHKILPTILSRCQIFDFNRIQVNDIVKYLEKISKNEGNEYDLDGLNIIAQKADGALRDALSIYDQIVSFSEKKVTYENVIKILNVLDYDYYFQLTEAFLSEDVPRSFVILDDILSRGFNLQSFVEGLAIHFRDLLVSKDQATVSLLETSDNIKERYKQMAQKCPLEFLYDCLEILNECELYLRDKKNPRLFTEIAFVKLCRQINKKKTIANSYSENSVKNDNSSNDGKTIKPVVEPTNISPKKTEVIVSTPIKPPISSPSLKNIINNLSSSRNEQNNVEEPKEVLKNEDTNKRNKPFTPTLLINQYNSFIESIRNEMPRMYSNLHQIPTVKDNIIEIVLPNQNAIEDFVHKLKAKLTNFLRDKVENDYIEISIELEKTEDKKLLYTSEEKFQYMVSKNPNLLVFKQKFDLDFE